MTTAATARERYLADFETLEREGGLQSPSWLSPTRRAAIARFAEHGFPTTRDEDWRYTNLAPLLATAFRPAPAASRGLNVEAVERLTLAGGAYPRLVFVDGRYAPALSSPYLSDSRGRVGSLAEAIIANRDLVEPHLARHAAWNADAFAALSTAFVRDGAFVFLAPEADGETPIELIFVATTPGVLAQPRNLIVAGPHSRLTVFERYVGLTDEAYFTNTVTEIVVGPGASVEHDVLQEQGAAAFHVATVHASLERDSAYSMCAATFGGRLSRTTVGLRFGGEGGRAAISGMYLISGRQHVDNHITVDHATPRCSSEQLYKGVLDGSARAVFNGRIIVRPDAQKTDANQTNKHLLLSNGVEVDSKPQLEIFADDVRCTHGAAEGQLAPEALFYLQSRGLGAERARALLTYGFVREVIERVGAESIRAALDRALMARLPSARAAKEM